VIARLILVNAIILSACAAAAEEPFCANDHFAIDAQHDSGDLDKCKFKADNTVELTFRREDNKVDGAFSWFSFRITAEETRDIRIKLRFPDAYARYWPKISKDGRTWTRADDDVVKRSWIGKSMKLAVTVDESGTWVSAQELITQTFYDQWLEELASHEEIRTSVIGKSVQNRPIHLVRTANKPEVVVLLGRQHPAEVPGALAMREFVDVLLGDTELAREFRERFTLLIVPLVNPDGVANGHSRHNAGRVDLNRDWGPFTQPETQSVARLMAGVDELGMKPRLMLDFHATKMTPTMVFYTQVPEDNTNPPQFATSWMTAVGKRISDYEFTHDPRSPSGLDNTKNYFFSRYGIPAITYEIGDEADRDKVRKYTPVFAEEMMRIMLQAGPPET
jgi:predicted deacylase